MQPVSAVSSFLAYTLAAVVLMTPVATQSRNDDNPSYELISTPQDGFAYFQNLPLYFLAVNEDPKSRGVLLQNSRNVGAFLSPSVVVEEPEPEEYPGLAKKSDKIRRCGNILKNDMHKYCPKCRSRRSISKRRSTSLTDACCITPCSIEELKNYCMDC